MEEILMSWRTRVTQIYYIVCNMYISVNLSYITLRYSFIFHATKILLTKFIQCRCWDTKTLLGFEILP
ncbi:hypothetical protein Hanom_Chr03g00233991 [Helianthus anomalus]